jgi:hypothetical protein
MAGSLTCLQGSKGIRVVLNLVGQDLEADI